MSSGVKIIIIGAGVAGIAAATRLFERGIKNVIILEAENRIGGRVQTADLGQQGLVDLGAQWVHGEIGNAVYETAYPRGLLTDGHDFDNIQFATSYGDIVGEKITEKARLVFYKLRHPDDVTSQPDLLTESCGTVFTNIWNDELKSDTLIPDKLRSKFFEWFHQFSNSIDGCDTWFDNSMSNFVEYHECPGNGATAWKQGGYANILKILLEKVNVLTSNNFQEEYVKLEHTVTCIDYNKDGVYVKCDNGNSFSANHVIVTVSLGVLKEKYDDLFKFNLPQQKIDAIKGLGFGTVDKMFIFFPKRWWPSDVHGFSLLWSDEDKEEYKSKGLYWLTDVFGFYKVDTASNALCGWIVGESARIMESIPNDELQLLLMKLLRKFLSNAYDIPEATFLIRSRWHADSNFRGSYSFRSLLSDEMKTSSSILSEPIKDDNDLPVILFAGEATHKNYFSTVHGALESGWREADNLIKICS